MARDDPEVRLRLPAALKAEVERSAQSFGRSMNADIVARIEASFRSHPPGQGFFVTIFANSLGTDFRQTISEAHRLLQAGDQDAALHLLGSIGDAEVSPADVEDDGFRRKRRKS